MIEFRVLGALDLKGPNGETLLSVLAQPKRVALLAYLAVASPNGFHRRDKLLGLFWAESDQEHGRAALRKALYFLRQSLGDEVVVNRGDEEVGLADKALQPARTLPHGDQRKLELGMILAPDPEVLMLDEPTAGMAVEQVPELMGLVQSIQETGNKTVVLVEHNMNVVMSVSDRITVMHQGALLAEGSPADISADERVQTAYLGELYQDAQKDREESP